MATVTAKYLHALDTVRMGRRGLSFAAGNIKDAMKKASELLDAITASTNDNEVIQQAGALWKYLKETHESLAHYQELIEMGYNRAASGKD